MKRIRTLTGTLAVLMSCGFASIAAANEWDAFYRQHPNHYGEFTNSQAWAGFIVGLGPDWFAVVRYGETIRIQLRDGNPRLFEGQRVRMIPFARDGGAEIAELRLPDEGYRPVGVVRYIAREVPRDRDWNGYGPNCGQGGSFRMTYGTGCKSDNLWRPPATTYRPPPSFHRGRWGY